MSSREGGFPVVLDRIGYQPHDDVSICYQPLGGPFSATSTSADSAPEVADDHAGAADVYFGVNPVAPTRSGRGRAEDVTRLTSLWADLDVKPSGMPTMAAARAVIDDISDVLGTRPAAVIESGHGLQPLWSVDPNNSDAKVTDANREDVTCLLQQFACLVKDIAAHRGGRVDGVFDLARLLRVPGTVNRKADPVPTGAVLEETHPTLTHHDLP